MKSALNFRQVEAFHAVMTAGTVVGAAKLLSLTQPAVSRAIALLEMRIGFSLFERRGRRLVPTADGEVLFREIEPLYGGLDRIAQVAQDIRYQRAGALRIATLPAMSQGIVPRAVSRFLSRRPNVSFFVQSMPSRQVADLVANRQFDVGLLEIPLSHSGLVVEPLSVTRAVAAVHADDPLARKQAIRLDELAGKNLVLVSRHGFLRHQIDSELSRQGVGVNTVLETPNSLISISMVAAGVGVALVSGWNAATFLPPEVVIRPIVEELTSRAALVYPDRSSRLSLADAFAEEIRRLCR